MNRTNAFLFASVFYLLGVWLGIELKGEAILGHSQNFNPWYERKVFARGQIVSDPGKSGYLTTLYFQPDGVPEKILVSTLGQSLSYGDYVAIEGKLKEPFSNPGEHFDYASYLKSRNVYGQISYAQVFVLRHGKGNPIIYYCLAAKRAVYKEIFKNLPYNQAALLISLLTGQKDFLSKETLNAFSLSGTAHIVAVSGFILTLIMLGLEKMSPYIGKRVAYVASASAGFVYMIMTAFAPGVVRAALMSALVIFSKIMGRKYALLPALIFTAVVLVIFEPMIIKYDLGFLLSFASILGIYFFNPVLKILFKKIPETFAAREIIATTISAQLATIPITLYFFDQFSIVAPLTNLLILPLVPALSIFGYICAVPIIGKIAGFIFGFPLNYILIVVQNFSSFPGASSHFSVPSWIVFAFYLTETLALFVAIKILKPKGLFATID